MPDKTKYFNSAVCEIAASVFMRYTIANIIDQYKKYLYEETDKVTVKYKRRPGIISDLHIVKISINDKDKEDVLILEVAEKLIHFIDDYLEE